MVYRFEDDFLEDMTGYQLRVERVQLERDFVRHTHSFSEVVAVLGGTACHMVGEQSYRIGEGDVFVINGQASHSFEQVEWLSIINFSYNERNLLFDREELRQLPGFAPLFVMAPRLREKSPNVGMLHLDPQDMGFVQSMADGIIQQTEQKSRGYEAVVKLLFQAAVAFLSARYEQTQATASQNLNIIAAAYDYMEQNLAQEFTVAGMAETLLVSPRHLERLFRQYCRETPLEHLTELRMSRALHELSGTNLPVSEVAAACGFADSSYFSRVFKARYHVSPRRYRELTSLKPFD